MPITNEIRERRRRFLGSSDISAIIGVNQYRNAGDLWLDKTGRLTDDKGSTASRSGQHLEEAALRMFEEERGVKLARDIWLDDGEFFCANLDACLLRGVIASSQPRRWNRLSRRSQIHGPQTELGQRRR
jgi:predicted phage-related endonuclease